ncbi:MAG: transporter substrate-binding protein, partial [Phycisphaerales bacterium]|nr:transporter substrate-binding protein [Phycisphaerales bacterium]
MKRTNWLSGLTWRGRRATAVLVAAASLAAAVTGCDSKKDTTATASSGSTPSGAPAAGKDTTVGFLYVGTKDDSGYNQAHAEGAAAVKKMGGVNVIEAEKIAENKDCQQNMSTMIEQGDATLVFATSFGYFNPHVKEIAVKYPKITFLHAGGLLKDGDPTNIGTFFAYIDELEYLCGMAAGSATKTGKLGYVAAKPITPVLRDINAFELGAKAVNPKCTLTVIFTGDWFLPNEEANAVTTLADQGVDVISGHVDSPKVMIQTAEKRGIYSCGYHYNCAPLAPKGYLTGAEWNWGPMYQKFVTDFKAGKPMPHNYMGSLKDGAVKLSPYG